jgi:leucyl aminopeptidase (aminopeptidase T)
MIPQVKLFEKTIIDVFDPKRFEKIGIIFDEPRSDKDDNVLWNDRRKLAVEWFDFFCSLAKDIGFEVEIYSFVTNGSHNKLLSRSILDDLRRFNVIIALTEWSITSSLVRLISQNPNGIRCASLPGAERRMHDSVYLTDYTLIKQYAQSLRELLGNAISAQILFSTSDKLILDLRNRTGGADDGDCKSPGSVINFPSGEGFIAPYEGVDDEVNSFGRSKTKGVIPFLYNGEIIKGRVEENKFIEFSGSADVVSSLNSYFSLLSSRRNIAELGIGCNPNAQVTGNIFEDEKAGVHIAYGMSSHLGGKVDSDVHIDLVFARGCAVEAEQVLLFFQDNTSLDLVEKSRLRYDILIDSE